ncbi:MAG: helix-turn-helix domain-containing protein [Clostridia bacterium]|nr:helix-turn-helix domain-containing protein [Clostridia bacterium]
MPLGKNIAYFRKEKGLTQAELGVLLGVSNQAVSKWETEQTMPDVMLLPNLAKVLDVSIDALYGDFTTEKHQEIGINVSEDDRRILTISVPTNGVDVKTRLPVVAIQSIFGNALLKDCLPEEEIEALLSMLENDTRGTLLNVDSGECKVTISVEEA